jgi:phosphatidylglycerol---prolipoprotein diacylglyceryl transferase
MLFVGAFAAPQLPACLPPSPPVSCPAVHPIAFELGPLTIHWYGVLLAVGFLAAFWTAGRRTARGGSVSTEAIYDLAPWLVIGTIIGARFVYVVSYWPEQFANKPFREVFMVHHGGLVFYGGLIGAALGTILFARVKKVPLWQLADVVAPSVALGHAIGRLGCLMNGCCHGQQCDLPWAIHFPAEHATHGEGVHPTQIYESVLNLALYAGLAWLFRRKRFDGQVFAVYLLGYAVLRSLVESFRGDYPARHVAIGLTPGQMVSIGILAAGLLLLWKLPRKKDAS